jgi:hypothetical protein
MTDEVNVEEVILCVMFPGSILMHVKLAWKEELCLKNRDTVNEGTKALLSHNH